MFVVSREHFMEDKQSNMHNDSDFIHYPIEALEP